MRGKRRTNATVVVSSQFKFGAFCERGMAWLVLSGRMKDLFQGGQVVLGDEHPVLSVCLRIMAERPGVMDHRHEFYVELKAEGCDTGLRPTPHRGLANAADDLSGLPHVVITFAVLGDMGRVLFHSAKERNFENESNRNHPVPDANINQHPFSQADGFFD